MSKRLLCECGRVLWVIHGELICQHCAGLTSTTLPERDDSSPESHVHGKGAE